MLVGVDGGAGTFPFGVDRGDVSAVVSCGAELITDALHTPHGRWDAAALAESNDGDFPTSMRHGGFMKAVQLFDSRAFKIGSSEAVQMDPQQRMLLERGYGAAHAAGHTRATLMGCRGAVHLGVSGNEFATNFIFNSPNGSSVYAAVGGSLSVASGRSSFVLGLHGPCCAVDSACSASLVACHASVRALQRDESDMGLTLGANLMLVPMMGTSFAIAGMTSATGRCHTFDARANGYSRGETCAAVSLSLTSTSSVHIGGCAVMQDGRSASLTAPSGAAQQNLLLASLADAAVAIDAVSKSEAHGTGTALGDPIEMGAAAGALLEKRSANRGPLATSALKANFGHAECGAGIAQLTRLVGGLQRAQAPLNAQLRLLNPMVANTLHVGGGIVPSQNIGFVTESGQVLGGGASSFGYSGTIAHATLNADKVGCHSACSEELVFARRAYLWRDVQHPFIQRRLPSSEPTQGTFRSPAAGQLCALVADHVVQGRVVFPGMGYLELARAAFDAAAQSAKGAALRDFYFLAPLVAETPDLWVQGTVEQGAIDVRSGTLESDGQLADDAALHTSGKLGEHAGPKPIDLAAQRTRCCSRAADTPSFFDYFQSVGLQYGPAFRLVQAAWVGEGAAAVGQLRLRSSRGGTQMHPADLDAAIQVGVLPPISNGSSETRLPFALNGAVLKAAEGELWGVRALRLLVSPAPHAYASRPTSQPSAH